VATFEKEYGEKVVVEVLNQNLTSQFTTAAMASKGPDILIWANDVVGGLAESGLLEPITLSKDLKDNLLPVSIDAFTYNGSVYGYPYDLESLILIYNKKLLPKVPTSLEELIAQGEALREKDNTIYPFLYNFRDFFASFAFFTGKSGYVFKVTNGKANPRDIGLNTPWAIKNIDYLRSLVEKGLLPFATDEGLAMENFYKGKVMATINGPWAFNALKNSKIAYGVAPIPTLNGEGPRPFVSSHGFMIRRSSTPDNKELAKRFIEDFLMTKKGIADIYKADPRCPSRKDVIAEVSRKDPNVQILMKVAETAYPMPNIPQMSAVWDVMADAIHNTTSGAMPAKKALDGGKAQLLKVISDKK
jgi:maltose/maltodextrin transport system substrate-binding protein